MKQYREPRQVHRSVCQRFFVPLQRLWKLTRTQYVAVNDTRISNMILLIQCYTYIEMH